MTLDEWIAAHPPTAPQEPAQREGEPDSDYKYRLEEWAWAMRRPVRGEAHPVYGPRGQWETEWRED